MQTSHRHKRRGFALLAIILGMAFLATLAATLSVLVAENQAARTNQLYMDQAFFSAMSGLEVARKQITSSGNDCNYGTLSLLGQPLSLSRSATKISSAGTFGNANITYSINNPSITTMNGCLTLEFATATMGSQNKQVQNVYVGRKSTCCYSTIYVNSMTISWIPNLGETLTKINFANAPGQQYQTQGNGLPSGSTFPFDTPYAISGTNYYLIDFISWHNALTTPVTVMLYFNMADGTTQGPLVVTGS